MLSAPAQRRLLTEDGVVLAARHTPYVFGAGAAPDLAVVVAHGFTGSSAKPDVREIVDVMSHHAGVISFDFRGHGRSSGACTMGDREVLDVDAAVGWALALGYRRVATLGFSMGGAAVIRQAAEGSRAAEVRAVATVSSPARWWFRGTTAMRRVHFAIEHPAARWFTALALRTRIATDGWDPPPSSPVECAPRLEVPLLVVHHERDHYFPVDHAEAIYAAAREPKELWIEPVAGHAESAATPDLIARIAQWLLKETDR